MDGKSLLKTIRMAERLGKPMKAGFDPLALTADLTPLGLRLEENLGPAEIEARYYQGRADRYHALENFHYAGAITISFGRACLQGIAKE